MSVHRRSTRSATVLVLLAAVACADGERASGPAADAEFNAVSISSDLQAMRGIQDKTVLESFALMSARFDLQPTAAAAVVALHGIGDAMDTPSSAQAQRVAESIAHHLVSMAPSSPGSLQVLPTHALGATYVFDIARRRYVEDPSRVGAPANGVRFILYAINPVTREPLVGTETGHADLLDVGSSRATGIALRLIVVSSGLTFLDYTVAIEGSEHGAALSVGGFMTDGTTRLNFSIAARGSGDPTGATMAVDFQFSIPDRDFVANAAVRSSHSDTEREQHIDLVVRSGSAVIHYAIHGDERNISATVIVNGHLFAMVRGEHASPEIRAADGRQLSMPEREALHGLLRLAGGMVDQLGNLLTPIDTVLALPGSLARCTTETCAGTALRQPVGTP